MSFFFIQLQLGCKEIRDDNSAKIKNFTSPNTCKIGKDLLPSIFYQAYTHGTQSPIQVKLLVKLAVACDIEVRRQKI